MADTSNLPAFARNLQHASYAGIPFEILSSEDSEPRKAVSHLYPRSDDIFFEDLGAGARTIKIDGYVVGDDVYSKRDNLRKALASGETNELVHPSFGSLYVNVLGFSILEEITKGAFVSVALEFVVVSGVNQTPDIGPFDSIDTQGNVLSEAKSLDSSSSADFLSSIGMTVSSVGSAINNAYQTASSIVNSVQQTVSNVVSTVTGFTSQVMSVVNDASRIVNSVQGIGFAFGAEFDLGPLAFGTLISAPPAIISLPTGLNPKDRFDAAVSALLTANAIARANVSTTATQALQGVAGGGGAPSSVQSLTEALRASCNSPSDQIRILSGLASYSSSPYVVSAPNAGANMVVNSTAALCRRAALTSLARSMANYQPISANDGQMKLANVGPLFDAEISYASSANDLNASTSLKRLKSKVVADILKRSAGLADVYVLNVPSVISVYQLAINVYGDATRYKEILQRNPQIVHPLFVLGPVELLSS